MEKDGKLVLLELKNVLFAEDKEPFNHLIICDLSFVV